MRNLLILLILFSNLAISVEYHRDEDSDVFPGRISNLNEKARLVRIKTDFRNAKYLNQKDRVEFWNESYPGKRCVAYVKARSNEYILLRIPSYNDCIQKIAITTGTYLHMFSPDLKKNLVTGRELMNILLKKRVALTSRKLRYQRDIDTHVEKMDAVNRRYEILRQKLELEWKNEISNLEEDRIKSFMNFKNSEARLNDVDHKLEKYKVYDQNLTEDRWSLDPKLYFKK